MEQLFAWLRNQWDRTTAVVVLVVGLVALLAGWLGVSRGTLTTEQLPYVASGAMFGLFALGVAATLWLSADLRDEWRELREIRRELSALGDKVQVSANGEGADPEAVASERVVDA